MSSPISPLPLSFHLKRNLLKEDERTCKEAFWDPTHVSSRGQKMTHAQECVVDHKWPLPIPSPLLFIYSVSLSVPTFFSHLKYLCPVSSCSLLGQIPITPLDPTIWHCSFSLGRGHIWWGPLKTPNIVVEEDVSSYCVNWGNVTWNTAPAVVKKIHILKIIMEKGLKSEYLNLI